MFRVRPEKFVLTVTKLYCFARQRRFGQESLSIFVRFAPNLLSVHDPDSPAQRVPGSVFRIFSGRTTAKSAILSYCGLPYVDQRRFELPASSVQMRRYTK